MPDNVEDLIDRSRTFAADDDAEPLVPGAGAGVADRPARVGSAPSRREEPEDRGFVVNDRRFWNMSDDELDSDDDRPKTPSFVERLQAQVEEKDKQLREYIAAYKQEVGEGLEKTRQRLERDALQQLERARGAMLTPMLEVLDALDRSIEMGRQSDNVEAVVEGVQMVRMLMFQKLGQLGLSRIEAQGKPFDPNLHEAMAVTPVDDPALHNRVVAEFSPGFLLGEKVLRPARVQVGKAQ